jgi:L-lactate dehydrogenase (cytochrome)
MTIVCIEDLRERARRTLPRGVFEFVDGGACDERTLRANCGDFARIGFRPRVLVDAATRKQSVRILGRDYAAPIILSPTGLTGIVRPHGEILAARAAKAAGVGYCVSTMATTSIEDLAAAVGTFWFQLYIQRDRDFTRVLMERAQAVGCDVLCLTVDLPVHGPRERDVRNGFTVPPRITMRNALDYALHAGWLWRLATGPRVRFANFKDLGGPDVKLTTLAKHIASQFDASVTWNDIEWLRSLWKGRIALKGILHPEDARLAVEHGIDAVIVSNHGGRQLDDAPSPISVLPSIVEAVQGRAELLLDGGVRRGSDIVKAMALGANGCMVGRAFLYGLAAMGEAGVARAIDILIKEVDTTLGLLGRSDISKLDQSVVAPAGP